MKSNIPRCKLAPFFTVMSLFFLTMPIQAATTLRITTAQLAPESLIEIIFDRAVASGDQISKTVPNSLLVAEPPLQGELFWKASNIAIFKPSSAPKIGTKYKFSIAEGHSYIDGTDLPAIEIKTISSEPFRVVRTSRRSHSIHTTRQPSFYVSFNDAVNPNTAKQFIYFTNQSNQYITAQIRQATWGDIKSTYLRGSSWQERQHGKKITKNDNPTSPIPHALMITPSSPLPVGKGWSLHLSNELTNADNNTTQNKDHNIRIGDIASFECKRMDAFVAANKPRQIQLSFNAPPASTLDQKQLDRLITVSPALKNLKYEVKGHMIIIDGDLREHNQWKVSIKSSLLSKSGLMLGKLTSQQVKFNNVPSGLALPAFDSAQYANGNKRYGIETVNLATVRIRVKQLKPDQAVRTMQGYRHYKGSGRNHQNISPKHPMPYTLINGQTIYDQTLTLDNGIDTSKEIELDWNTILPKADPTTPFFISVEGTAKKGIGSSNRIAQSFIQLTDIGLCWKLTEKEALIYAFSCQTGQPLQNVRLQVFNDDSQKADSSVTDANGIARLPRHESAMHLRATLGKDCYIVPFDNTLDTVSLWRFPVQVEWNHLAGWKRSVLMFTDRNLYRPGETVQLKGIVRRYLDNQIEHTPGKLAQLTITDSSRRVLVDKEITLSQQGSFDHTLTLPAETVGRFTAKLVFSETKEHAEEDNWKTEPYRIFHHQFYVQEFRRNAFEITSSIPPTEPGASSINLDLEANYYQGQAVKEGLIKWYFNATQTGFYPKKFRDYLFGNHRSYDSYYWSHYFGYSGDHSRRNNSGRNGEGTLDVMGKSSISYDLPELTFPTALNVVIHSEITDAKNQTLSKSTQTTVHPADTYIGISRIDRLVRVGEDPKLEVIAVDTRGEPYQEAVHVTAIIEREYYEAVKIQSSDGKTSIKNTKHTEQLSEFPITIPAIKPITLPFKPTKSGRHIITLKGTDSDGHDFATASRLYIYGSNEYPWASEDGMKIKLVPEKQQYNPSDTARILVMTPIEGTALITVERAGVHREYRRELNANKPVIELPLTDMDAPNVFVSVIVIRGANASPLKHKEPALKLGYCTLNVTNSKDRLAINLKVEGSQHRPAEPTTITGIVTRSDGSPAANAEVVLYAEDEGTLAVAGYKNPDPMSVFHAPRPLLVQCGTSFSTFISENPGTRSFGNKGFTIGGGPDEFGDKNLNLIPRTDFNPCAVWKPGLITDDQGGFSATFTNPDTLTRYRVIAVALHGQNKFGSATTHYNVDKPIMLDPAAPRFASEGDTLQPKVLVQNNSEFEGIWEISLATTSITESPNHGTQIKTISLKPGGAATVYFDTQFVSTGTARWIWTAKPIELSHQSNLTPVLTHELSDQAESTFEVTYPVPLMRQLKFVTMDHGGRHDLLNDLDPKLLSGRGHIELELSNSLLLEAGEAVNFLLHYPYGCVEQTTSSMTPWFAVRDLKTIVPGFKDKQESDIKKAIQAGADRLLTMQTRDGGLAYWPGGKNPETWASAYGGMGLLLARKHGANVPEQAIDKLTSWLSKSLKSQTANKGYWKTHWNTESRARALYVLALAGKAEAGLQNNMLDRSSELSSSGRAYLALALHHSGSDASQSMALLNDTTESPRQSHWMRHTPNQALQVLAWSEISPSNQKVHTAMREMIAKRNPQGHWRTTWCNSWSLQAMASYASNVEKNRQPSTLQLEINGETKTITLDTNQPTHTLQLPLQPDMKLVVTGKAMAHAKIKLSAKPELAPTGPWANNGLALVRRYERLLDDGTTENMGQPHVGDLIKVSLDVTFPSALEYVVIEDRLPSLFETVNNDFASQSSHFRTNTDNSWEFSHKELRSDRAVFFMNRSWRSGTRTIAYLARVTSSGIATAPAAKVEAMYDPEQLALSSSQSLTTFKKESIVSE